MTNLAMEHLRSSMDYAKQAEIELASIDVSEAEYTYYNIRGIVDQLRYIQIALERLADREAAIETLRMGSTGMGHLPALREKIPTARTE